MSKVEGPPGKLPGKTEFAGRRRAVTRKSGFTSSSKTSGGEFRVERAEATWLRPGQRLEISLDIQQADGVWAGFGGWFWAEGEYEAEVVGSPGAVLISNYQSPNWNKVGSLWRSNQSTSARVVIKFVAKTKVLLAMHGFAGGAVQHRYLDEAREALLKNMHQFAPEANFYSAEVAPTVTSNGVKENVGISLHLKSCNRCARYLPINIADERSHLSFSNHCVAAHRRPCAHPTFGRLRDANGATLKLDYGFQLECRFCKKFEVNSAHNPQRTMAQMKEDAARRRAFELLLTELYGGAPQLLYRAKHKTELQEDVFKNFGGRCFNCSKKLSGSSWHLDHTRPLKYLWPLDGTATALCGDCNTRKRDRSPAEFYKEPPTKLVELARIVGIPLRELRDPAPNVEALTMLVDRLDWLFDDFLRRPEMLKERDGKVVGELVAKALQKVAAAASKRTWPDFEKEYSRRMHASARPPRK